MFATARQKALWLTATAAFAFALLAIPRLAFALPCEEHYQLFYSDDTYTDLVGGDGRDCFGQRSPYHWGDVTSHYIWQECCCDNGSCSPSECDPATFCSDPSCPEWVSSVQLCNG